MSTFASKTVVLTIALMGCLGLSVRGQLLTGVPEAAKAIRVDEKLGTQLPLGLRFLNERGEPTDLARLIDGTRPALLTLNYSGCPGLCVAQLNGLTEGIAEVDTLKLGSDFLMVSVSIDPRDTPEKVAAMKARYADLLPKHHDRAGWHFLTADAKTIETLADTIGFRYTYDAKEKRFNHASVAVGLSPTGKITRYLYEIGFAPETLRLSLIEASEGRIGTTADQILLWCFHYDPEANRYSADARRLLSFAAGAFVLMGIGASAPFWFGRRVPPASDDSSMRDESAE